MSNKFHLVVANYNDLPAIEDWILTVCGMLSSVGKNVSLGEQFCSDKVNIVWEGFNDAFLARIESAAKDGCKIIVIATEYVTGKGFNRFHRPNSINRSLFWLAHSKHARSVLKRVIPKQSRRLVELGKEADYFQKRYRNFVKAAQFIQCIWVAEPIQVPFYRELVGVNKCVFAFPYCWFRPLHSFPTEPHNKGEKTWDIFFSGSLTLYRKKIMHEFETLGISVIKFPQTTSLFFRNHFAERSRIILDLKKDEDWAYTSNLRLHYHLLRGDFVACEQRKYPSCLQPYVFPLGESLTQGITELIYQEDHKKKALEKLEKFRRECPASRVVPELLARCGL